MVALIGIVQSYVPQYRLSFFEGLIQGLRTQNIDCVVLAGAGSQGAQAFRGDAIDASWIQTTKATSRDIAGTTFSFRQLPRNFKSFDGLILPLEGSSLSTFHALNHAKHSSMKTGVWGHVKCYVNNPNRIDMALERFQMDLADHVFAYTRGGASYAEGKGISPAKITTVMNTLDTRELVNARARLTHDSVSAFVDKYDLVGKSVFGYIGGIDASKRIDFLVEALDELWDADPSICVLVAGEGAEKHLLRRAFERGQVRLLGYAGPMEKLLIASVAHAFLNPGRIGLTAVDGLVLGRPIITTKWPYHAPEFEYLSEGTSVFSTEDSPVAYAEEILRWSSSSQGNAMPMPYPTLDDMVEHFSKGVVSMLNS